MRLAALFLISLSGLALRLGYAFDGPPEIFDSAAYGRIAVGLFEMGKFEQIGPTTPSFVQPATNYTPGLPLLLGGIYALFGGANPEVARVILAVIGAAAIPLTYLIARRLTGAPPDAPGGGARRGRLPRFDKRAVEAAGLIAAATVAFYPPLLEYAGLFMPEPLGATLIASLTLGVLVAQERNSLPLWALLGICLGAILLVRPDYLLGTVLLILVLVWLGRSNGFPRALAGPATMLGVSALLVVPWIGLNSIEAGRLVPISTGGGQALFTGSYIPSGGDPQAVGAEVLDRSPWLRKSLNTEAGPTGGTTGPLTLERILEELAIKSYPGMPPDIALSQMGRDRYLQELRSDPVGLAEYLAVKAGRIWVIGARDVMREPFWVFFQLLVLGAAIAGLTRLLLDRRPELMIIGVFCLTATLVGAILVASPRRVLVLWPLVAALAGSGLALAATILADIVRKGYRGIPLP